MSARYCPHCGGPNSPTAAFCQYCGAALPAAPSAPLPSSGPAGPPPPPPIWGAPPSAGPPYGAAPYGGGPYGGPAYGPPPTTRPKRRVWVWILVGFVVLILVVGLVSVFLVPSTSPINVTGIDITSPDNVCGLNGATSTGFGANLGDVVGLAFSVSGNSTSTGSANCTIVSVSSATSGFSVSGANTPLYIPVNTNETLEFNVTCPNADFSGVLTFSFT